MKTATQKEKESTMKTANPRKEIDPMNTNAKQLPSERHGIPANSTRTGAMLDWERQNTNAKHTPGPWTAASQDTETNEIPIKRGKSILARVAPRPHWDATQEANARLIAAAPAMLEALRYAAELIPTARRYFPKSVKFSDRFQLENVCATIGKAIAQAEGGAQ